LKFPIENSGRVLVFWYFLNPSGDGAWYFGIF